MDTIVNNKSIMEKCIMNSEFAIQLQDETEILMTYFRGNTCKDLMIGFNKFMQKNSRTFKKYTSAHFSYLFNGVFVTICKEGSLDEIYVNIFYREQPPEIVNAIEQKLRHHLSKTPIQRSKKIPEVTVGCTRNIQLNRKFRDFLAIIIENPNIHIREMQWYVEDHGKIMLSQMNIIKLIYQYIFGKKLFKMMDDFTTNEQIILPNNVLKNYSK